MDGGFPIAVEDAVKDEFAGWNVDSKELDWTNLSANEYQKMLDRQPFDRRDIVFEYLGKKKRYIVPYYIQKWTDFHVQ